MDPRIPEYWEQLSDFILFRNSLDLGALSKLLQIFSHDSNLDPSSFADQITTFLTAVTSHSKTKPQGEADCLSILAVDALLKNLYLKSLNGQAFQSNSSSFYGWMSSSQMSIDHSNVSEREAQLIPDLIAALANSQPFFKRLKALTQRSKHQQKIKRYVQSMLQTIDPILSKQRISRESFLKLRGKYIGLESRRKFQISYSKANSIIFSSQLNKVVGVLAQGGDEVHLALLRIYLSWNEDSKSFQGGSFIGEEMLTNLYRYYINSFKDIDELFQEGKHPIFRFLRNHLALLFTPVLRRFHQLIVKVAPRCGSQPGYPFYKKGTPLLQNQLTEFVSDLPGQLLRLLLLLKDLVEQQHPGQSQFALSAVKKMFFYSFLLNQPLMEELYPRHDPSKWSVAYNHVLNLFFQGSMRKYSHLPQNQQTVINQLVEKLAGSMDSRIGNQFGRMEQEEGGEGFGIRESIINHDFQVVMGVLAMLEFTPKDSKQFEMRKIVNVAPESPVYKHLKGQTFKTEEGQEELEMATWMSVGGSKEWGSRPSRAERGERGRVGERLKGLKTIAVGTRVALREESESFRQYFQD